MSAPTATRTFLFTDIEGSTRRWQADAAAMSAALARHDALVRSAIEAHGGEVFKTVGDAFCAAFERASDAVAAAASLERAVAAEDWEAYHPGVGPLRVRVAVHAGEAETRDGDWLGRTLNRAARLLAVAHGGQVLVSRTVEALVADALPTGVTLRDLGRHRLKDLVAPEHVFQVLAPGLVIDFPALASLDAHPNNLPAQPTSTLGREDEVDAVRGMLERHRLVTLTGIGGTGKTRLAVQVAAEVLDELPDGAWFVDLAPVVNPALVAQAAAVALGLLEEPGRPLGDTLTDHLASRRLLLVLDNCEHVLQAAAELADAVLRRAPRARVLATSRELLGVPGEHTWAVPPLDVPSPAAEAPGIADLERLMACPSVQLFVERAVATRPDFRVTPTNAAAVAGICRRLDGIPLAIELAAARVRHLDPGAIVARLDDRFPLLTGGSRTVPSRQQTLEAALDWSHDLLDGPERTLFRRLSVFRGGWTLESAEAVCADPPEETGELPDAAVLDVLGYLVDKSLVVARDDDDGGTRYAFLETLRQYAGERLHGAGETKALVARHLAHFEALTALAEQHRNTRDSGEWLERLDGELDNLRAALDRVADGAAPPEPGIRLAGRLWWLWLSRRSTKEELAARCEALLGRYGDAVTDEVRAMLIYTAATAARHCGRLADAQRHHKTALELARRTGLTRLESWCHNDLGNLARGQGDLAAAERHLRASLRIKEELGVPWEIAITYNNLAHVAFWAGDMSAAIEWSTRGVEAARLAGSVGPLSGNLGNLAYLSAMEGRTSEARAFALEACQAAEASREHGRQAEALQVAGVVDLMDGRVDDARDAWCQALRHALRLDQHRTELLAYAARLAVRVGDYERAARLAGAHEVGTVRPQSFGFHPRDRAAFDADMDRARTALGAAAWDRAFGEGQAMLGDAPYLEALAWIERAGPGEAERSPATRRGR